MTEHETRKDYIKRIQTYLRKLGYTGDVGALVPIDGIYGSVTSEAVRSFQEANNLIPTGTVNKETWDMLYMQYDQRISNELEARGLFPFPDTPSNYAVSVGTKSALVAIIQLILDELESRYDDLTDIRIDGIYGEDTANAVRAFQRINMLDPTGEVDKATWNRLVREYSNLQYS